MGSDKFVANTTELSAAELNKLIDRSCENVCRNSSFESWTNGAGPSTSANPDAWVFQSGGAGATIEKDTLSGTGRQMSGDYCAKVNIASAGGVSYLYQEFTPLLSENLNGRWFSASMKLQCITATDKVRLYIDDGMTKEYSSYAGPTLQTLTVKRQLDGSATKLIVGVEFLDGTYSAYVDDALIVEGQMVPKYVLGPPDQCVISKYFDSNGVAAKLDGSCQIVAFKIVVADPSGITATASYTKSYTLKNQCNSILFADASMYSMGTTAPEDVNVTCNNYATSGFDIVMKKLSGSFTANEAYEIRGFYIAAGYKNGEVFDVG